MGNPALITPTRAGDAREDTRVTVPYPKVNGIRSEVIYGYLRFIYGY